MDTEVISFKPSGWVPNNTRFPVLIYRSALTSPADVAADFARNGWTGVWRNGVFDSQHYHSGAHEILGVGCGAASLLIGGQDGRTLKVSIGDCLLLPAGTGHMNLGSSPDFEIVGAYPPGQHADVQTSAPRRAMLETILGMPAPSADPLLGQSGGLLDHWH